jgi:hypothetical protein
MEPDATHADLATPTQSESGPLSWVGLDDARGHVVVVTEVHEAEARTTKIAVHTVFP